MLKWALIFLVVFGGIYGYASVLHAKRREGQGHQLVAKVKKSAEFHGQLLDPAASPDDQVVHFPDDAFGVGAVDLPVDNAAGQKGVGTLFGGPPPTCVNEYREQAGYP